MRKVEKQLPVLVQFRFVAEGSLGFLRHNPAAIIILCHLTHVGFKQETSIHPEGFGKELGENRFIVDPEIPPILFLEHEKTINRDCFVSERSYERGGIMKEFCS